MTDKPKEKESEGAAVEKPPEQTKAVLEAEFGKVYIKLSRDGHILRPIKASITLFERVGHIYKIAGKGQSAKYAITSAGYRQLNKVASISILSPLTVVVDGHEQPNPWIERDKKTHGIRSVIVRKIGIGYSPAGNITAIDKTLYYNPYTYFIQSIQAKMKRTKWSGSQPTGEKEYPNAAVIGEANKKPDRKGSWVFFPIEEPLGIWANYEDDAISECLDEHTQRQRFGERIAQTIVERNILKDHPAIGVSNVLIKGEAEGNHLAYVEVYGYRHDMGLPEIQALMPEQYKEVRVERKVEEIHDIPPEEEREAINEDSMVDAEREPGEDTEEDEERAPEEKK
jgi:hypothetical protein